MHRLRTLIRHRPLLAALIVAAALALRVLVPGGFMPMVEHGRIVVKICSGSLDGAATMGATIGATRAVAMPGMAHHDQPADMSTGKCAYADLAQAMTGGADPVLLSAALAFVLALTLLLAFVLPPRAPARLRPPLRGPPATV